tara:strand:- start:371 stop:685 length:315 start_codon:yes stop_codon:yes gene_type:complete
MLKLRPNVLPGVFLFHLVVLYVLLVGSASAAVLGMCGRANPATNTVAHQFDLLGTPGFGAIDTEAHVRIAAGTGAFGNYKLVGGHVLVKKILGDPKGVDSIIPC